jgi:uncharacterized protein YndB with AHSA1/START domain
MDSRDSRSVVVTRSFDAPVAEVWKAWSDPDYVRQWWGPIGFTCPLAQMDFREGGTSLVCMRAPQEYGGGDMYNGWTYRKIEPLREIAYVFTFTDKDGTVLDPADLGLPAGIPREGEHVVTFKDLGSGKTEMTVTEQGYTVDETVEISRMGLEQCLDKMAAILAGAR